MLKGEKGWFQSVFSMLSWFPSVKILSNRRCNSFNIALILSLFKSVSHQFQPPVTQLGLISFPFHFSLSLSHQTWIVAVLLLRLWRIISFHMHSLSQESLGCQRHSQRLQCIIDCFANSAPSLLSVLRSCEHFSLYSQKKKKKKTPDGVRFLTLLAKPPRSLTMRLIDNERILHYHTEFHNNHSFDQE